MDYEKVVNDIKTNNKEELIKDNTQLRRELTELDTVGKLANYLKTLDQSKKVYVSSGCMNIIVRPCDVIEKDDSVHIG
jgi:hypothetical protein